MLRSTCFLDSQRATRAKHVFSRSELAIYPLKALPQVTGHGGLAGAGVTPKDHVVEVLDIHEKRKYRMDNAVLPGTLSTAQQTRPVQALYHAVWTRGSSIAQASVKSIDALAVAKVLLTDFDQLLDASVDPWVRPLAQVVRHRDASCDNKPKVKTANPRYWNINPYRGPDHRSPRTWLGVSIKEFINILDDYLAWQNEKGVRTKSWTVVSDMMV